jgi:hypothetical protein
MVLAPLPLAEVTPKVGGRRHRKGASVKTLKRALKAAGLKVSGKKATLTRRAKKAHLLKGGVQLEGETKQGVSSAEAALAEEPEFEEGGRRRSRKNGLVKGVYRGVTGVAKGTLRSVGRVGKAVFGRARKH